MMADSMEKEYAHHLRQKPLCSRDQCIVGCLEFTSELGCASLPLKGLLERLHVRSAGSISLRSGEKGSAGTSATEWIPRPNVTM